MHEEYLSKNISEENISTVLNIKIEHRGPPLGVWRDSIFEFYTNIWPSLGCFFCCNSMWIFSQLAHRTHFSSYRNVALPLLIANTVCIILYLYGVYRPWIYFMPLGIVYILSIWLRIHIVRRYSISQYHTVVEILIAVFLFPLSVTQMSRHVYGYRKFFEGDSAEDTRDFYNTPVTV